MWVYVFRLYFDTALGVYCQSRNIFYTNCRLKPYGSDSDDSGDEGADFDVDKLEILEVGPGEHKLQYSYCLWFAKKGSHRAAVGKHPLRCV